jgi:hypothetical protein
LAWTVSEDEPSLALDPQGIYPAAKTHIAADQRLVGVLRRDH